VVTPAKIKLMPKCVFRQSKPAIVGVEVLAGTLQSGCRLMRGDGKVVGWIKEMQRKKETVKSAESGEQIAIAIGGVTMGRQLNEGDVVYSFISMEDMAQIDREELSVDEVEILKEMREIRKGK
jgi:translation initiation factor 5B